MTDLELITALNKKGSTFALQLVDAYQRWGDWTPRQRVCAERIFTEINTPKPVGDGPFKGIVNLFATAKSKGLKRPSLHFIFDNNKISVSKAPDMQGKVVHRNAGCLYLKYAGMYCGKINPDGVFEGRGLSLIPASAMDFLNAFSLDPVKVGSEYGRKSGCCCFCGSRLTDGRSLAKGYGPVCAIHWELPWGDEVVDNLSKKDQSDLAPDVPVIELLSSAKREALSSNQQDS